MDGWIKLYRKTQENFLWKENRKFSKFEAWIDILFSANCMEKTVIDGFDVIVLKAGSFITSEVKLSKKWNWHRNTVRSFLRLLENQKMCTTKCTTKCTILTVTNWELYQFIGQPNVQRVVHRQDIKRTTKGHKQELIRINKNINNINKKYIRIKNPENFIQKNYIEKIGGTNTFNISNCISYLHDMNPLLIQEALKRTSEVEYPNWKYCKAILDNWQKDKIFNLKALKEKEEKFKKRNNNTDEKKDKRIIDSLERENDDIF